MDLGWLQDLFTTWLGGRPVLQGLAVGVAFGSEDLANAVKLMLAIGLQNVPEGLAVAVSALNMGIGAMVMLWLDVSLG